MLIECCVVISKQFKTCLDFLRETKINEEMEKDLKGFDGQLASSNCMDMDGDKSQEK